MRKRRLPKDAKNRKENEMEESKMTYAGLTISDKPALLEAKERGKTTLTMAFSDRVQVVNIDFALAQIAEMESAEKPQDCEYCAKLSKYAGWGYAEWFEQMAVDDVYEISVDVKFCPNCGNQIASPYTEGETK